MVQDVDTAEKIQSCMDASGHWDEPFCNSVLLAHGFTREELSYSPRVGSRVRRNQVPSAE